MRWFFYFIENQRIFAKTRHFTMKIFNSALIAGLDFQGTF